MIVHFFWETYKVLVLGQTGVSLGFEDSGNIIILDFH